MNVNFGLRGRFVFFITVGVMLTVTASVSIAIRYQSQRIYAEMVEGVSGVGHFVALTAPEVLLGYDMFSLNRMMEEVSRHRDVVYGVVLKGERPITTYINEQHPQLINLSQQIENLSIRTHLDDIHRLENIEILTFPITTEGEELAKLEIGVSLIRLDEEIKWVVLSGAFQGLVLLLILAMVIFWIFQCYVINTLKKIVTSIETGQDQGCFEPAEVVRHDELGQVATSFNRMMAEVLESQSALFDREQNLSAITDAVQEGIVRIDQQANIVFWNYAAENIFGYSEREAIGQSLHQLLSPSYYHVKAQQAITTFIQTGKGPLIGKTTEVEALHADGHLFPIELTISSLPTVEGWHAVGVVRDISERKRVEEELRLAATAFETDEAIIITDSNGAILRVNRAFTQITGYKESEAVGNNPSMLQSGRQSSEFYQQLWQQLQDSGQWRGEIWNRRKNGEIYPEWLSISAVRNAEKSVTHYIGIFSDLSEQFAQQNQIRLLLNSTAEGILGTNLRGEVIFANDALTQMLGIDQDILKETSIFRYLHFEDQGRQDKSDSGQLVELILSGTEVHGDDGLLKGSSAETTISVEYWIRPIMHEDRTVGLIMTCVNINARKEAEAMLQEALTSLETRVESRTLQLIEKIEELEQTRGELVQSEKMASLGRLVAGFAHEINTPIGIAVGGASMIEDEAGQIIKMLDSDEILVDPLILSLKRMAEASSLTLSSLQRSSRLVESFKRTAVDQSNTQLHSFELCQAIQDVVSSLHSEFKRTQIEISVHCQLEQPMFSKPGSLEQMLTNLLMNSIKHGFMDGEQAGIIDISVELVEDDVVLRYRDSGVGMDEITRERIFEPFFTTARGRGGSGLGLFICYNLVTGDLGGSLECKSSPGEGCEFEIRCPLTLSKE